MNETISLYDKDCLPTWGELYNEFYFSKKAEYNHLDMIMDPYWKQPRQKILLAFVCNQLNKMIFEDHINPIPIVRELFGKEYDWIEFKLITQTDDAFVTGKPPNTPPVIYHAKNPSTNSFSVFTSYHPHVDIETIEGDIFLMILLMDKSNCPGMIFGEEPKFWKVIDYILKDVIIYFGKHIGWKDKDGNVIPSEKMEHCQGLGYDPAL
jgi:hypothetical protein